MSIKKFTCFLPYGLPRHQDDDASNEDEDLSQCLLVILPPPPSLVPITSGL